MGFLGYEKLQMKEFSGLSSFQFLTYFRRTIFYTFVAIYLRTNIGMTTVETSLMATIGMVLNTGAQSFVWGPLLDRIKRSSGFVVIGEIIAGFGHILIFIWHRYALEGDQKLAGYSIIIGLALVEIFWSMSNVGWSVLISEYTSDHERKKLMGQLSIIGGLGGIFGASISGFLYQGGKGFSEGSLFYIAAAVMIISSLLVFFTIKDKKSVRLEKSSNNNQMEENGFDSQIKRVYIIFLIALAFINFGRNSMAVITGFYLVDPGAFAATDQQVAFYRNVSSLATITAGLALSTFASKFKDTKVMLTGTIFALISMLWLVIAPSYNLVLISGMLNGAAMVIIQSAGYSIVASIIPVHMRGKLFAYFNATFFLSWGISATFITAPISDYLISQGSRTADAYRVSYIIGAMILTIGIGILLYTFKLLKKIKE